MRVIVGYPEPRSKNYPHLRQHKTKPELIALFLNKNHYVLLKGDQGYNVVDGSYQTSNNPENWDYMRGPVTLSND